MISTCGLLAAASGVRVVPAAAGVVAGRRIAKVLPLLLPPLSALTLPPCS
jgi:hypothetical protein